jgi:hypothetical protein
MDFIGGAAGGPPPLFGLQVFSDPGVPIGIMRIEFVGGEVIDFNLQDQATAGLAPTIE